MTTVYENKNNPELSIVKLDDKTLQDGGITVTDVGVGFLAKAWNGKEVYIDDEMVKQMVIMMQNRKD